MRRPPRQGADATRGCRRGQAATGPASPPIGGTRRARAARQTPAHPDRAQLGSPGRQRTRLTESSEVDIAVLDPDRDARPGPLVLGTGVETPPDRNDSDQPPELRPGLPR